MVNFIADSEIGTIQKLTIYPKRPYIRWPYNRDPVYIVISVIWSTLPHLWGFFLVSTLSDLWFYRLYGQFFNGPSADHISDICCIDNSPKLFQHGREDFLEWGIILQCDFQNTVTHTSRVNLLDADRVPAAVVGPGHKVARWQNLIPSFPWIAPGMRGWGRNPRKVRDQILQRSVAEP